MLKRLILTPFLIFSFLACGKRPDIRTVEVPCGGYTMDGVYSAQFSTVDKRYDEDGNVLSENESAFAGMMTARRIGCATTLMGVGWHSVENALIVDISGDIVRNPNYADFTYTDIKGACTTQGCVVIAHFTRFRDREWDRHTSVEWVVDQLARRSRFIQVEYQGTVEQPNLTVEPDYD